MIQTKLVIFGITGDLSKRKLLPALKHLYASGNLADTEIIGVSRRQVKVDELLHASLGDSLETAEILQKTRVFSMDVTNPEDYARLKDDIAAGPDDRIIIYLSVPPRSSVQMVELLGRAGLNSPNVHLLLEKPFGVDLASAQEAVERIKAHYDELQVYRIDHYLAKEMAQNIVAFRGGNALFSAIWNSSVIERIEVVALETIGIEGRTEFYEQTGALRDLVQGHLMQLLALTLMDIPHDFAWEQLPERRLRVLQQLAVADPSKAHRAQYAEYKDEVQNPDSSTETFASIELTSNEPRWRDVSLQLITGKAMNAKTTEVRVHLRKQHDAQSNCIIFRIQPNEGIEIELFSKKPGYDREFVKEKLSFNYPDEVRLPDAYEQVLIDAIRGQKSLFAEGDEIIRSWQVLNLVQEQWKTDTAPLQTYASGASPESIVRG
jgi:glucose-6-phosphate 1-dehydrogenase